MAHPQLGAVPCNPTIRAIATDNLLVLIKKQTEHIKEISKRNPSIAVAMLERLSNDWVCVLPCTDSRSRDVTDGLLTTSLYIQQNNSANDIHGQLLSTDFLSKLSDMVIDEMLNDVPEQHCQVTHGSRNTLWMLNINGFEQMLLATTKACVENELQEDSLREIVRGIGFDPLLASFATDYYQLINLLSTNKENVKDLSYKMFTYLKEANYCHK